MTESSAAADSISFPMARCWRLRTRALQFDRLPTLMGIINVTPDSFSDGGEFF